MNIAQRLMIGAVRGYRRLLSPVLTVILGPACRFEPSCSEYAMEAIRKHGVIRGTGFAVRRISRCHPWGGCGRDPVPGASGEDAPADASKCRC
jgi:putative membrane protein insertion efficiency factor